VVVVLVRLADVLGYEVLVREVGVLLGVMMVFVTMDVAEVLERTTPLGVVVGHVVVVMIVGDSLVAVMMKMTV
jgi:hypothetical protein